ncbi:hypothetical protein MRX96_012773 [Rhipicephalus microplus]
MRRNSTATEAQASIHVDSDQESVRCAQGEFFSKSERRELAWPSAFVSNGTGHFPTADATEKLDDSGSRDSTIA